MPVSFSGLILIQGHQCTEMRFASFLSGGFTAMIVINPPERKLAKRISVQWMKCTLEHKNWFKNFLVNMSPRVVYCLENSK